MAKKIIENKNIGDILVPNIKIAVYADDTFLLLHDTESSLIEAISVLKTYSICSGLCINLDKTVWLGKGAANKKEKLCTELNLNWVTKFTVLGIAFNVKLNEMECINYWKKLVEIEKMIKL